MTQTASSLEELFARVAALSTRERTTLARWILESIESEQAEKDPGYDEAWDAEIRRRIKEADEHPETLLSYQEAMEEVFGPGAGDLED